MQQSTSPTPSGPYFRSRLDVLAVVASVALGLAVFWMFRFRGWYAHDDGALGQAAERILRGQVPHRDFDDPYTGGLAYLHALVFRFGGIGTSALRNHLALVASVWFAGVFWLLTHWLRPVGAALVSALIAVWTLPLYPAAMPSWYILFLTCAAGGALVHWYRRVYLAAGIAGVLIGLAALAKINAAFALSGAVFALVAMRQTEDIKRRAGIEVIVATAVFGALVMRLVSSLLDARVFAHLALPALAIVAGIAWREVKHGQSHGFGIDIELWRRIAVLMIGAAIPIGIYAFWLAQHGALAPFLSSVNAVVGRRAASAAMSPPTVGSIIYALPFLVVLLASSAQLRIRPLVIAGAGIVLGILGWFYPAVHADIWEGLRGMLPAGAMLYCWAWPGSLPTTDSPARRGLTVFAPIAAIMALTQYPFSATIYFVYVLPLLVLALSAAVALRPPTTQRSAALLAFLLVLFAVTEVIPGAGFAWTVGMTADHSEQLAWLDLPRSHLLVPADEAARYRALVATLDSLPPGPIWAGPDAPEVAFLSGRVDLNRTFFKFLYDSGQDSADFAAHLADGDARIVVIDTAPSFSRPVSLEARDSVTRYFPGTRRVGYFQIHWRGVRP